MKNKKIYPWVVVGLFVGCGTSQLYGPPDAFYYAGSNESGHCGAQ